MRIDLNFEPSQAALTALKSLHDQGHSAHLVGGCVRDAYLGRMQGDYDITTSALPHQIKAALASFQTLDTGLAHGTVTALVNGDPIEITTYRVDGAYSDGRHPDQVTFTTNLIQDLARRDFTCNAMAWNPQEGLIDPFKGREDCNLRVLRAVGDPQARFREDALRILRALRFSCQLGFTIQEQTLQAIRDAKEGLEKVAKERIAVEINKAFIGDYALQALRLYPRVLFEALPELAPMLHTPQRTPFHIYDVWEHSLLTLAETPPDITLRWAALFHDSGKPHTVTYDQHGITHFNSHQEISVRLIEQAQSRLKLPRIIQQICSQLVRYHDERVGPDNLKVWIHRLGYDTTRKLLRLQRADLVAHAPDIAKQVAQMDALFEETIRLQQSGVCVDIKGLAVNGQDLMRLGIPKGPQIGKTLDAMLQAVLRDELVNDREQLLAWVLKYIQKTSSGGSSPEIVP